MALIFDTNALSAFADGDEKLLRVIKNESELALPAIVLGEYLYGIQQSRLRASYETWIQANLRFFDILPIVHETAERYAEIRHELQAAGTPVPTNDLWIAALARQRQLPFVSHFRVIQRLHVVVW